MNKELKNLINKSVNIKYNLSDEHIFVVNAWIDTLEKEKILVRCIKKLKEFNIPILLITSSDTTNRKSLIIDEIKQLVDYFLIDAENELLPLNRFNEFKIDSIRWTENGTYSLHNYYEFHHDYAVIHNMKIAFDYCNQLGKKFIHYVEYDNEIDTFQYYQTFVKELLNDYDVVYYEYDKDSTRKNYCAVYLMSLRIEIALKLIENVTTIEDHFSNSDWRLEYYIFNRIKKYTSNYKVSDYIDNNKTLNLNAVWNRPGINRNGIYAQFYLVANDDDLYLHILGSNQEQEFLIDIRYLSYNKFFTIRKNACELIKIGKYAKDEIVNIYYKGNKIFEDKLSRELVDFIFRNEVFI